MTARTRSAFAAPTGFVAAVTRQKAAAVSPAPAAAASAGATISLRPAARPETVAVPELQAA